MASHGLQMLQVQFLLLRAVEEKGAAPLEVIYSTDSLHQAFGEAMQAYVEGSASKEDTISTIEQKYQEIDGASN